MTALLSAALFLAGLVFLFAAALGVLRFADPLQRMHAATKAGTVGAGFTILGAVVTLGTGEAVLIGGATVLFLLLTVPVAGHLLGRAAYVSGAELDLAPDRDALRGELPRASADLDTRLEHESEERRSRT